MVKLQQIAISQLRLVIFTGALGVFLVSFLLAKAPDQPVYVSFDNQRISAEIAITNDELATGLSNRESLGAEDGMLFIFNRNLVPAFWMREMNFALDIIWINEAKQVVGIARNVSPDTFPMTFSPNVEIMYALEVNGGYSQRYGLNDDTQLDFDL